jgi:hypothetical protein
MDIEQLKRFIADSRLCSETKKCAVACATDDLERAPWCDEIGAVQWVWPLQCGAAGAVG